MANLKKQILPVLQVIIERCEFIKDSDIGDTIFICVQHLLFTTVDLIESLIRIGAKPSNIHIMGKIYSSCPEVVDQLINIGVVYHPSTQPEKLGYFEDYFNQDIKNMWSKICSSIKQLKSNKIIVLDDGGKCILNIPDILRDNHSIFAVEQTSSGICKIKEKNITVPLIDVAFSAVKQLLESTMIADAVLMKLMKLDKLSPLYENKLICGIAGLGVIGKATIKKLLSLGHKVIIYDKLKAKYDFINQVEIVDSCQLLFQKSDYIFGCTGDDITIDLDLAQINGVKNLISCSSQDNEFRSLLRIINKTSENLINVLDDISFSTPNGVIKIFRGGYPVNLDNSGESVPAKDIQLTRGLLLGGVLQAILQLNQVHDLKKYMLHPKLQKLIVQTFVEKRPNYPFDKALIKNFLDAKWIRAHSISEYIDNDLIAKYF